MKITTIAFAVAVATLAHPAHGLTCRYMSSGDYLDPTKWSCGVLPGVADTVRFNWGSNTVTLAGLAPNVAAFQMGVDESGGLIVTNGGSLTAGGNSKVGNNNNCTGFLTVCAGGSVAANGGWMMVAGSSTVKGILTIEGGTLSVAGHLWAATGSGSEATIHVNGGTLSVGQMLGLGTIDAVNPSGGTATLTIDSGGVLALSNIHSGGSQGSIQPGSLIDIKGTGQLTLPGNFVSALGGYVAAGRIVGNGVVGNVTIDTTTNPGFTTATATSGPVGPPGSTLVLSVQSLGGGTLELSWPMGLGAFGVETSTNDPGSPGSWSLIQAPVSTSAGRYTQIVSNTSAQAFYRLVTAPIDNTTLSNKSMMGYQGWFSAPGDGTLVNDRWHHWGAGYPTITSWKVDFWPDMSEFTAGERFAPGWTLNNGGTAQVFSSAHPKTVERHFQWMWDHQIDGVFLQRFINEAQDPRFFDFRNKVTANVKAGAEKYSRVFAIMYDISGAPESTLVGNITSDWNYLVSTLGVTNSPSYLKHRGKPVVTIWGLGFSSRDGTPQIATNLINFFKGQGMTVMGGVPDSWRTLNGDSKTDPAWADVYRSFDVLSPWTVGRYNSLSGANNWRVNKIVPDLAAATVAGVDYMPVIWPGFSWYNLKDGASPLNQIPRLGGNFYWRQFYNCQLSGCSMIYTAMFDEVDEGTAMFKMAETVNDLPAGVSMVPLDIDGTSLPSDWYLQLAGEAGRMLRGEIPLQSAIPIAP